MIRDRDNDFISRLEWLVVKINECRLSKDVFILCEGDDYIYIENQLNDYFSGVVYSDLYDNIFRNKEKSKIRLQKVKIGDCSFHFGPYYDFLIIHNPCVVIPSSKLLNGPIGHIIDRIEEFSFVEMGLRKPTQEDFDKMFKNIPNE